MCYCDDKIRGKNESELKKKKKLKKHEGLNNAFVRMEGTGCQTDRS